MHQTIILPRPVYAVGWGNCVGKTEGQGPLGHLFDRVTEDDYFGRDSFEQAEQRLQQSALEQALVRAAIPAEQLQLLCAGDLLNQCVASAYNARRCAVPYIGLYGACSTMALSTAVASMALCAGAGEWAAAVTSSHFCTAERQFRYPLEYGAQRPPAAQRTVTGAGALILSSCRRSSVRVRAVQLGQVVDFGIQDINNMGAAMAPAAMTTLCDFFCATNSDAGDYDRIVTGDLGRIGGEILQELTARKGYPLGENYTDCGQMIFAPEQDAHAGGSGCGCSAAVLTARLLPALAAGEWQRLLFMATGALMSPLTVQQKDSIPAVAHLILFEREETQ